MKLRIIPRSKRGTEIVKKHFLADLSQISLLWVLTWFNKSLAAKHSAIFSLDPINFILSCLPLIIPAIQSPLTGVVFL